MQDITRDAVLQYLRGLTSEDRTELLAEFGLGFPPGYDDSVALSTPTEWDVMLYDAGQDKISVMRTLRTKLNTPIRELKALVDSTPCRVLESVSLEEAHAFGAALTIAGATVKVGVYPPNK